MCTYVPRDFGMQIYNNSHNILIDLKMNLHLSTSVSKFIY